MRVREPASGRREPDANGLHGLRWYAGRAGHRGCVPITVDLDLCGGRPCILGMRIRVLDVLEPLARLLKRFSWTFSQLEADDIAASLHHAARHLDHPAVAA